MSDDANDEGVSKQEESKVEDFGIDRAEFERLQAQDARIKKLDGYAEDASTPESPVENAEAYVGILEDTAFAKEDKPKEEPPKEPAKKTEKPNEAIETLKAESEESKKIALQAQTTANNTELRVQYAQFKLNQDNKPEEERSPATREELIKIITGPDRGHLGSLASEKFDGNVWDAANYIFTIHEGAEASRKAGAASEVAKANAIASASIPGNRGRVADPITKTPEEKAEEANKELADEIAPDTEYVMPT